MIEDDEKYQKGQMFNNTKKWLKIIKNYSEW